MLGLATRLVTLPMLAQTFVVTVFVYPEDWIEHVTWVATLLFVLTRGPVVFAVGHWLACRRLGR